MRRDPHSYADLEQGRSTHLELALRIDFDTHILTGVATLHFAKPVVGVLDLEGRGLEIDSVVDAEGREISFCIGPTDPVLGERIRLDLTHPSQAITLRYRTAPDASALIWLRPEQTDGGVLPFVLTQCQAIHARSIVPLQDSPMARITYSAELDVPATMRAVMSAGPGREREEAGRRFLSFEMPQAIPPYLLAFAVGDLTSRDLDSRCRVFAEPGVIEAAAWEFAEVGSMLGEAEKLFGDYAWERYDFVVLPPSFPLGGMENPRMTFLTPTLLAGDRSLVGVLAHELAHSWTGNLVTNANNEHFWLNEGWTVWAERRILEVLYGTEEATQQAILGRRSLEQTLKERRGRGERTSLLYDQSGLDPDDAFSLIPYELGFLVVVALERAVGRERFDRFVAAYIEAFSFRSITTEHFITFLREQLPEANAAPLEAWVKHDGIWEGAPAFQSERLSLLAATEELSDLGELSTTEKLFLLGQLRGGTLDPVAVARALSIDSASNAELRSAWLSLAIEAGTKGLEPELESFINTVGRTKLLRPLIREMAARPDLRDLALQLIEGNQTRWHGSTTRTLKRLVGGH